MTESITPLSMVIGLLGIIITAWIGYWLGQTRDKAQHEEEELARLGKEVQQLKVTAVSEQRVREIIKDAIEPTGADVRDIKVSVNQLTKVLHEIQVEIAAENAFKRGKASNRGE